MKNTDGLKNNWLFLGALFLFLAVAIGAFGAHGLTKLVSGKAMATFKTGVTYQFYHGFALLFVGLCQSFSGPSGVGPSLNLKRAGVFFIAGILLFSFNCYLYALTEVKAFAMVVPLGGVAFLVGWSFLLVSFYKRKA